jgi:predicted Rossmann fold nucleotide-binding protein DprA/Smf involved in DNA uptake
MTDFLEEKTREISERLEELRPYVDEFNRLEAAHRALAGVTSAPTPAAAPARSSSAGQGRPRGSGTRATEALEAVRTQPGITIPELAQRMGIQQNYLYRVLPGLEQEGKVRKEGRGWFAVEGS